MRRFLQLSEHKWKWLATRSASDTICKNGVEMLLNTLNLFHPIRLFFMFFQNAMKSWPKMRVERWKRSPNADPELTYIQKQSSILLPQIAVLTDTPEDARGGVLCDARGEPSITVAHFLPFVDYYRFNLLYACLRF